MSIVLPILLLGCLAYGLITLRRSDDRRLRQALSDVPGEIVSMKLVSMGNTFGRGQPRTYRVVSQLPGGARLIHRVELRDDGSVQRTL